MTSRIPYNAVDVSPHRIYGAEVIEDLARIVLPHKRAAHLRTAFLLIAGAIMDSVDERVHWVGVLRYQERLYKKGRVSGTLDRKALERARRHLRRRGIIELRGGMWRISQRFPRALEILAEKLRNFLSKGSIYKQESFIDALNRSFAEVEYRESLNEEGRKKPWL